MRTVQRLFVGAVAIFVMVGFLTVEAKAEIKIGVLVFTKENHYSDALSGIMDHLKKEGFAEPRVKFIIENAEGNKAKAAEFARKFAADKLDMVMALGTSAAVAVVKEIKNAPIVFSMIYDPVEAQIVQDWKSSGNNATGSSNKMSMSQLLNTLKSLAPVKRLAVLYQANEKNSVSQLKDLQEEQNNLQIKVIPVPITSKEDLSGMLSEVVGAADAVYLAGGSIVGEMVPAIVDIASKAKMITVSNLPERVEKGVLLGVCANSYNVGLLAGEKAVKVLKGAKPSSVPIGTLSKFDVLVNTKTAKAAQIQISPAFLKAATKVIE